MKRNPSLKRKPPKRGQTHWRAVFRGGGESHPPNQKRGGEFGRELI